MLFCYSAPPLAAGINTDLSAASKPSESERVLAPLLTVIAAIAIVEQEVQVRYVHVIA
jgi:hypothetical protein